MNTIDIIFKNCDLPLGAEGEDDPGIMLKTSKGFQIPNADGEIYFLEKPKISADSIQYAKELEDKTVEVTLKTGKDGRSFGSVSPKEIADAAKKQFGY